VGLDNKLRRFLQDPRKILAPYLREGMTVMDLGCGPGFFTLEMAYLTGPSGKVIAADIQQGMLDIVEKKIRGTFLEKTVQLHLCPQSGIGYAGKADFILAFYVIHEIPDKTHLFLELYEILEPGGMVYIVEPAIHVTRSEMEKMLSLVNEAGFKTVLTHFNLINRTVILSR